MICKNCNESGRLVQFATFSYYFCNNCKDEIPLEVVDLGIIDEPVDMYKAFAKFIYSENKCALHYCEGCKCVNKGSKYSYECHHCVFHKR